MLCCCFGVRTGHQGAKRFTRVLPPAGCLCVCVFKRSALTPQLTRFVLSELAYF